MDREQVRRDATYWNSQGHWHKPSAMLAAYCLALLAELEQAEDERDEWRTLLDVQTAKREQAERERDEWMTPFDGSGIEWHESLPSPYTYQREDFSKLVVAVHEYESRALTAEARLAAYEQAQEQR